MEIHVKLKQFLLRLEAEELSKPEGLRRDVPTIQELADATGVTRASMSNLANNNQTRVNLAILSGVVKELTRRGFEVDVDDLFELREDGHIYEGKSAPVDLALTGAAV